MASTDAEIPPADSLPGSGRLDSSNTITLHVLSPALEVNGGRITFPAISLDTTITQLKSRIRNSVATAPSPERQRLIYRGRPLLDGSLSLKTVFQSEPINTNDQTSSHTLHLVLPPAPQASAPSAMQSTTPMHGQAQPNAAATQPLGAQLPLHVQQQMLAQAQAAQQLMHNQLHLLQQQMGIQNPGATQTVRFQTGQFQMPLPQFNAGQQVPMAMAQGVTPAPQNLPGFQAMFGQQPQPPNLQAMLAQHQQMRQLGEHHGHAQTPLTGTQNTPQLQSSQLPEPPQLPQRWQQHGPMQGMSQRPSSTTTQETSVPIGPTGRADTNSTGSLNMPSQSSPSPASAATNETPSVNHQPIPHQILGQFQFTGSTGVPLPPMGLPPVRPVLNSNYTAHIQNGPGFDNAHNTSMNSSSSGSTSAWLLQTPTGPQALVFAPGHGYFSGPSLPATTAQLTPNRSTRLRTGLHFHQTPNGHIRPRAMPNAPNDRPLPPAVNPANAAPAQIAARPGAQAQPGQANNDNDMFQFIMQRGWLFLRMYIFLFFISEPGTWRRWFLLAAAVIICMLPRDNPLRDAFNQLRRHFDGLLPTIVEPAQQGAGQNPPGDPERRANAVPPAQPTAPLLADQAPPQGGQDAQDGQNNSVFREAMLRVERAVALFLASLVPGVGEQHVRARERQRQEAERIENERVAAENSQRAEAEAQVRQSESGGSGTEKAQDEAAAAESPPTTIGLDQGTSTAVDTSLT